MNMPSMPSVPGLPKQEQNSGEASVSQAPFTEESVGNSADSDVGLDTPSHIQEDPTVTPQISSSLQPPVTQVSVPTARKGGIQVVATRKGFYNQLRYKEGDAFTIRSKEELGEWMKCVDSSLEKERVEFFKQKRIKARA